MTYIKCMPRKRMGRPPKPSSSKLEARMELKMSKREKKVFTEAAARHGISLSHWLRLAAWRTINEKQGSVELVELDQ